VTLFQDFIKASCGARTIPRNMLTKFGVCNNSRFETISI